MRLASDGTRTATRHVDGVQVPDEVSVVGFDDIQLAAYSIPPLTTVHVDFRASGHLAIDRLLHMIGSLPKNAPLPEPVPPVSVTRASSAPVRSAAQDRQRTN